MEPVMVCPKAAAARKQIAATEIVSCLISPSFKNAPVIGPKL
jgi:hypothetical protein